MNLAPRLARRTPFFYGWVVLFSAGASVFARNAAASLTVDRFGGPLRGDDPLPAAGLGDHRPRWLAGGLGRAGPAGVGAGPAAGLALMAQGPEEIGLRPDGDPADPAEDPASPQDVPGWTLGEAVRTPALWILAAGTGLLFLVQAGTNTHAAAFFRDQGLDATTAGLAISLNAAFLGLGGLVWGRVVEGLSPRYVMGSALFPTADTPAEALACSSIFGFGLGGMLTVPPVAYADYFGRRSLGAIRGVTEPFTTFGQAVGALVPGVVFDHLSAPGHESYRPAFAAFAALGALTTLMLLLARPPRRPPAGG